MADVKTAKWKYLRENDKQFYDPARNTALNVYLDAIFPDKEFIYNSYLPKDRVEEHGIEFRRFKPDVRCEVLNLIIEFDGIAHYQDLEVVIKDREKDAYYALLGYNVVRIPYWIQLSNAAIKYYFGIDMKETMCELPYSFYDPDKEVCNLHICPGSMCYAGLERFIDEVNSMPVDLAIQVYNDIKMCIIHSTPQKLNDILPPAAIREIDVIAADREDIDELQRCMLDIRDQALFGREYHPIYYLWGIDVNTNYPYTKYKEYSGLLQGTFPEDVEAEQTDLLEICENCPSIDDLALAVVAARHDRLDSISGCVTTQCIYYKDRNNNTAGFYDALVQYANKHNKEIVIDHKSISII